MNKSESKYFNTSKLMNKALLLLLEHKDLEFISVKEICEKAGVNRSTFYLHYDTIDDLFEETITCLNKDFIDSFEIKDVKPLIKNGSHEEIIFINEKFLKPYLEFVKRNKRTLKAIYKHPILFKNENLYSKLCEDLFLPILSRFGVKPEEQIYRLEYFTRGTAGIIKKWLENDCELPISRIIEIVIDCVNFSKK